MRLCLILLYSVALLASGCTHGGSGEVRPGNGPADSESESPSAENGALDVSEQDSGLPALGGNDGKPETFAVPGGADAGGLEGDAGAADGAECSGSLMAQVRDFKQAHPDFESFIGQGAYTGLVEVMLGEDHKPVYAHTGATPQTTGRENFDEWYRDVPGVNETFDELIQFEERGTGLFVYENTEFFPLDDRGFGNEGNAHNYHFTTEIHTRFTYSGGENFTFEGDDDLWIFVNGRLALDLGGLHGPLRDTVDFDAMADELEIEPGQTYAMDIFHAERHTSLSNFRIETSILCFEPALE